MDLQVMILRTATGKQLSEYQLNLLSKNNIKSILHFYEADEKKLHELLDINVEAVRELKKELSLLSNDEDEENTPFMEYGTGIEELDKLLDSVEQPFKQARVWELSGPIGVGKTQMMYTFALNFVWKHRLKVLFIDTKGDFSCKRIQDMLRARNTDMETSERVMKAIQVVQAQTGRDLIDILKTFDQKLATKTAAAIQTQFVVIDSLAACFVHFRGKNMQMLMQSLLVELACNIRKLAGHGVTFLIGNVSFFGKDADNYNDDGEDDDIYEERETRQQLEPTLGAYWRSVCTLRLSLELPEDEESLGQDDGLRLLHVISNTYGPVGDHCLLRITDVGFV
ncbi:DNA repair protein RAD51 homolog 4 [Drosophila ficusphila]|uniref:DNA repair protein RAD51 homolog 4 n=1 Tax=Drosophila ficusphila TaxID=30025 RepID=UPI001C89107A|nr:DNA repair protein RAD51 homolog 4 [Drosophila ficusphila]